MLLYMEHIDAEDEYRRRLLYYTAAGAMSLGAPEYAGTKSESAGLSDEEERENFGGYYDWMKEQEKSFNTKTLRH